MELHNIIILIILLVFDGIMVLFLILGIIVGLINKHRDEVRDKQYYLDRWFVELGLLETKDIMHVEVKEHIYL